MRNIIKKTGLTLGELAVAAALFVPPVTMAALWIIADIYAK